MNMGLCFLPLLQGKDPNAHRAPVPLPKPLDYSGRKVSELYEAGLQSLLQELGFLAFMPIITIHKGGQ